MFLTSKSDNLQNQIQESGQNLKKSVNILYSRMSNIFIGRFSTRSFSSHRSDPPRPLIGGGKIIVEYEFEFAQMFELMIRTEFFERKDDI